MTTLRGVLKFKKLTLGHDWDAAPKYMVYSANRRKILSVVVGGN